MSSEIEDLERLIALRDAGEIDEEEFNALKQQLLSAGSSGEQSSEERKQLVGLAVVVTLLVCGAAFGIFKAVSGSSDGRPDEERAFIDQFVSTGVVSNYGGLGDVGFESSDAECVGNRLVDRVGVEVLSASGSAWLTSDELPPEIASPFFQSMDDCVDLRKLAAIGMAQEAEVDSALFECALEDLSDAELIQLLSAPIDEYSFEEDEAMARLMLPVIASIFDCAAELPGFDLDDFMDWGSDW